MFLIIWRGYGILAPIIAALVWLVPLAAVEAIVGHSTYTRLTTPLSLLFGLAAAAAVWLVGIQLNSVPGRLLIDPRTGQQVVLRKRHDLFFIPMQWWAIPLAGFAVAQVLANHLHPRCRLYEEFPAGGERAMLHRKGESWRTRVMDPWIPTR